MDNIKSKLKRKSQRKYLASFEDKGLVRVTMVLRKKSWGLFEEMTNAYAEQFMEDIGQKLKLAKAKRDVFDNMVNEIKTEFLAQKDKIESLNAQVAALSPQAQYFKTNEHDKTDLPDAIAALSDDKPDELKAIINKFYKQIQQLKHAAEEYKRRADQLSELYEVTDRANDSLRKKLKDAGIQISEY